MANSARPLENKVVQGAERRAAAAADSSLGVQASAAANDAGFAGNDSSFEGIANKVDKGVSYAWNVPLVAGAGGWLLKKGENLGAIGAPIRTLGRLLSAPQKFLEKHELGHVKHLFSGTTNKVAGLMGSQSLTGVSEALKEKEAVAVGAVSSSTERTLGAIGGKIDEAITDSKTLDKLRTKHVARLRHKSGLAQTASETAHAAATNHLADAEKALKGEKFAGVREVIGKARADLAGDLKASTDPAAAKKVTEALAKHQEAFDKVMGAAGESRGGMFSFLRRKPPAEKAYANFAKQVLESHSQAGRAETLAAKATFRGNLKAGFSAIPGKLSKMTGAEALNHGIYYGSQGVSAYRAVHGFTGGMSELKSMYAHEKGISPKDVSAFKILMGNDLPPSMQDARRQYLKANTIKAVGNAIGMVAFHHIMKGGKSQMLGVGVQMVATMGGDMLAGQGTVDAGQAIDKAHARGMDVPKGAYIALLAHASPKVRNLDESDANLVRVADQYAKEKLSAGAVMKEIDSGAFDKRFAAAAAITAANLAAATPAANDASFKQEGAEDALPNARKAKDARKPVGKHTEAEEVRRVGANGDAQRAQI